MTEASAGVQYSEDGHYWWDGSAWQPVDSQHSGSEAGSGNTSGNTQYSEDGKYWWDGSQWQPVDGQQDPASQQDPAGQQGQAGQQDTVDWTQFPLIEALTKVSSPEDWIRHLGLEPDDLNVQGQDHQ